MKGIKELLSLILIFAILTAAFSSFASFAAKTAENEDIASYENAYTSSGVCGDALSWALDEKGTLTVSGSGKMYDYTKNNSVFCSVKESIKSVVLEEGVTSVGDYAFYGFTSITSVTFAPSVNNIGRYAFRDCTSISELHISDMAAWCRMGNIYNGDSPLYYSNKLYLNNELVTDLVIPEGVEVLSVNAFSNCTNLESITIPKSLKYINSAAFYNCTNLKAIYISDMEAWLKLEYRASQSNPLYFAHDLYLNNELITDIVVPTGVEKINEYAFIGSTAKSVTIPDTVKSVGKQAFYNCTDLSQITIPDSVEYIAEDVFTNTAYYVDSSNWDNGVLYIGNHLIKAVETLSGNYNIKVGTKTVAAEAFLWCDITAVTIPDGVIALGREAFSCCDKLLNVTIPESITKIENSAFNCCESMYQINLPSTLKEIGAGTFSSCHNLETIDFPDSLEIIGSEAFIECYNLYSFKIGSNVKRVGMDAFAGTDYYNYTYNWVDDCLYKGDWLLNGGYKTTSKAVKEGTKHIADGAFYGNIVDEIKLPETLESIGEQAFYFSSLNIIKIPKNVTVIGSNAFRDCDDLKEFTITSELTAIGEYAFEGCSSLERLYIPDSVTYIGEKALYNAPLLTVSCSKGSYAESYAIENNIPYVYVCELHSFTDYVSNDDGDCYNDSTMTAFCDNGCGVWNTITEENSKRHSYEYTVIREATCLKSGLALNKCTVCGNYYSESIPKPDHLYSTYTLNNDATCTENGTKTSYCDYNCGSSITVEAENSALGHKYSSYSYNNDATCMKDGTKTAVCTNGCGLSNTITATNTKLSHKFTSYQYNNDATCTEDGTRSAYCDYNCGTLNTVTASGTKKGHSYIADIIEPPTCTEPGTVLYICSVCFDHITEEMASAHTMGEWTVVSEATESKNGELIRHCLYCDYTERDIIPMLPDPEIVTEGYSVYLSKADQMKYIRYAKGEYTTAAEIKNAQACVTLDSTAIARNSESGIVKLDMSEGGVYTFWVKLNDSYEGIYTVDLSKMEQVITTEGVSLTVKNLYGVKDYFIAKGEYDNYSDVRANAVVQITKNKIGAKHDFTYTLSEPGTYTVYLRYEDPSREHKIIIAELTVTEPEFEEKGLQLTVKNLDDIRVIRTAYGDYTTPGQIKKAQGNRAFSGKDILKNRTEYTIQYRDEGNVTVAVVYNNGYEVIYNYNVIKRSALFTKQGSTVTIDGIEDFKVIRYAQGVYSTSAQIKNAPKAVAVSSKYYDGSSYSVTLQKGTYTFCIQYNDESYCYYTIVIE